MQFKLDQKHLTSCPPIGVEKIKVDNDDKDIIFVCLPEYWVRINLADGTFASGIYEG